MADENYLYAGRQRPFQSLLQGFGAGQGIMGNISQANMASMKNEAMQRELDKQKAVQNALVNYGQPGFDETAIMRADPEMGIKISNLKKQATAEQLKIYGAAAEIGQKIAPSLVDNFPGYVNFWKQMSGMGMSEFLPHPLTMINKETGQPDINLLNQTVKRIGAGSNMFLEEYKQGQKPPDTRELKVGDKIITQEWDPVSKQYRAIGEAGRWDDKGLATITTTNADGTTTTVQVGGKPGQAGMGNPPPAQGEIYKKLMGHEKNTAKLNDIVKNYDPQYQTYGGKAWNTLLSIYDKINPNNITEEQGKYLEGFAQHKADTFKIMNEMLNALSGAAVTEHEMRRLTQQMPNAGTGILDGDNPRAFQAKLKSFKRDNDLAIARYTKWAKEGVIPADKNQLNEMAKKTSLDDMQTILLNRAKTVIQDLRRKNPQLNEDQLKKQAAEQVNQEYGLR